MQYGQNAHTDEDGQRLLGCPPEFWGTAIVCFLDMLGFSPFVFQEFSRKSDEAIQGFLNIRNHPFIESKGKESVRYGWYDTSDTLPDHLQDAFYRPVVHTASDSVILSAALPRKISSADFVLAFLCLNVHISWIVKQSLDQGFALRGGIELGEAYWNERDIIGPALINAYRIESKIAKHVRILYGPDILKAALDAQKSIELDLFNGMWMDLDGLIMLKPDIHSREFRDDLRAGYEECQERAGSRDEKAKYDNLLTYFKNHPEMPQTNNFDSDYVAQLLTRYKYGNEIDGPSQEAVSD